MHVQSTGCRTFPEQHQFQRVRTHLSAFAMDLKRSNVACPRGPRKVTLQRLSSITVCKGYGQMAPLSRMQFQEFTGGDSI